MLPEMTTSMDEPRRFEAVAVADEQTTVALDDLDNAAARLFDGYLVRKDLARQLKGRFPVPEYVAEFLVGRYCASVNAAEIAEGMEIVEAQLRERTVRPG